MTEKMKQVGVGSSPYGVYGVAMTMFKHQTLMQDYQELQRDVEASRNKLENAKQRKLTLLTEVRFLRRRYKCLLKNKSPNLQQPQAQKRELVQAHYVENQRKNRMKVKISNKKEVTLHKLPPVSKLNQKGKAYMGKEASLQNKVPSFDLNRKEKQHSGKNAARINSTTISNLNHRGRIYKGKEVAHQGPMPVIDLNHQERIYNGNGAVMRNPASVFDLNQKETAFSVKQASLQSRAPVFDLNQISREEEESQDNCEPLRLEEPKKGLINEDQLSDLKLSICRNVGDSSSRATKRKISWQDSVALRV